MNYGDSFWWDPLRSAQRDPQGRPRLRSEGFQAVKRAAYVYKLWLHAGQPWPRGVYVSQLMLAEAHAGLLCACAVYRFARRERLWPGMGADGWEHVMGRWI